MASQYMAYLAFVLIGTLALQFSLGIRLKPLSRLAKTLLPVAAVFIAGDMLAVAAGFWTFNPQLVVGSFIGNQPIEEVAFFFVVPLFYLTVWEIAKAKIRPANVTVSKGLTRP